MILGMSLITPTPRVIPMIFHRLKLSELVETWIKGVPYAALSALTIPGVFKLDPNNIYVGVVGFAFAVGASILKLSLYATVFIAILAIYGFYLLF
ncbi:MAG: AzlD domain-containing protein [Spirochaetes bacterium]|nr:MAG: AzlD domain-containing protein [Spirochaetota bacterium]